LIFRYAKTHQLSCNLPAGLLAFPVFGYLPILILIKTVAWSAKNSRQFSLTGITAAGTAPDFPSLYHYSRRVTGFPFHPT
jgi:hypothetical protein